MEKKRVVIQVRLEESEKEIIKEKASNCGLNLSQYVISSSLNKKLIAIDQIKLFESMRGVQIEMNSIGKNINQYVKLLNMLNKVDGVTPDTLKNIENMLLEYKDKQDRIYDMYKHIRGLFV
ncbi:MAG: plasmid mobilization protein [Flavobacteriales bacterium]|jgi:Glu-tRNA(Gln) amidotransferase subunit E-like FAD-binding protein